METVWIIGAGNFGLSALKKLSVQNKKRYFTLVDKHKVCLNQTLKNRSQFIKADGLSFVVDNLKTDSEPDWIIPTLPLHLLAEWSLAHLRKLGFQRDFLLPSELDRMVPNSVRGENGDIYASHATFKCPDNCCEPEKICTVTKMPREKNMFEILEEIKLPSFQ